MAAHADWLHRFPPFRMPRFRRARHHHDAEVAVIAAFFTAMARLFVLELVVAVWLVEVEAWLIVWFYYGLFLGCRWVWRKSAPGSPVERPQAPAAPRDTTNGPTAAWIAAQDPYGGMGVDTRAYETAERQVPEDPWDTGSMRRRG